MDRDANRDTIAAVAGPHARGDCRRALPARLLDRRPEFVAQPLARHGEQTAPGLAPGHPQIAVGLARVVQAPVRKVDQDGNRPIGRAEQRLLEAARATAWTRSRARPTPPKS